jgi:hypothetical protein
MKLLREVLKRANKQEKQEYENTRNEQRALAERYLDITNKWGEIIEVEKVDVCPKDTSVNDKPASEMSMGEFREYMRSWNNHTTEYFKWSSRCLKANSEQLKIIGEIMKIMIELRALEEKEKWLLISIVLRSQPNLLNYLQG